MNKLTIQILILILINGLVYSANERFRSVSSGSWNSTSTWEMSTNNGSTWFAATSTPSDTSGLINIRNLNTITVTINVAADQLTVESGGTLTISSSIFLTILNGSGNDFTLLSGGSITGFGTLRTQGIVDINLRGGSTFTANLNVSTGTTTAGDVSSPYVNSFLGNVTVDSGSTLQTYNTLNYTILVYGNLTNNGTVTGTGAVRFYGQSMINNGVISPTTFTLDSNCTISGSGIISSGQIWITANGNIILSSNVTFSPTVSCTIYGGAHLSPNGNILTFNSGILGIAPGATVTSSGTIRTKNTVTLNVRTGSNFSADLNVNTGTTIVTELSSPLTARLYGSVTVDSGATLSSNTSVSFTLFLYGNLINNGIITGSGAFRFSGSSLTNNGSITSGNFQFDSISNVSGLGTFTGGTILINSNGNVSLLNDLTFSPSSSFNISTGGVFSANGYIVTFNSGTFTINTGATVVNSGIVRTRNNVLINPKAGSNFNANLNVNSGITTVGELSTSNTIIGNVSVDSDAIFKTNNSLSNNVFIFGDLINNGTITGTGSVRFYGQSLINNGGITPTTFTLDSTSTISGSGSISSGQIWITVHGNIILTSNVTFSPTVSCTIFTGGNLSANENIFTFGSGTFNVNSGATVNNSGLFRMQNYVTFNPRAGSNFQADLNINTGTTVVGENNTIVSGNITIDVEARLSTYQLNSLSIFGNLTNNGIITGNGTFRFGGTLINYGSIESGNFYFDSSSTISGSGTFTGVSIVINSNVSVVLLNDITFSLTTSFLINSGGVFSLNGHIFTFCSGTFTISSGATILNSGTVRTKNYVIIDPKIGSSFNADLIVNTGTTIVAELTSNHYAKLFGNVTVDSGAILSVYNTVNYTLFVYGNLTNNGTITGTGAARFYGSILINNGVISPTTFTLDSICTISGSGKDTSGKTWITVSGNVTLASNQQMNSVIIYSGGILNLSSNVLKLTGAGNPLATSGTIIPNGGTIEYYGTSPQTLIQNLNYVNLTINNPAGVTVPTNFSITGVLSIVKGDLNLNGKTITLDSMATLSETPGNTVTGTSGFIVTTRNINTPDTLNVAGIGAILTSSSNLGQTQIIRGHALQNLPGGIFRIYRYYTIIPTKNSGLNATIGFSYDESELNGIDECGLQIFKSTNGGTNYSVENSSINALKNRLFLTGINSFFKYTAGSSQLETICNYDAGVTSILNPILDNDFISSPIAPMATIKNFGKVNQTNPVSITCLINPGGYSSTKSDTLSVGLTRTIIFDSSFIPVPGTVYNVLVYTGHMADTNTSNDTIQQISTFDFYNFGALNGYFFANNLATDQSSYPGYKWKDTVGSKNLVLNGIQSTGTTLIGSLDDGYFKLSLKNILLSLNQDTTDRHFKYNGTCYDSIFPGTNGVIGFTENFGTTSISEFRIDGNIVPNNALLPFWKDFDLSTLGIGTNKNRLSYKASGNELVITYDKISSYVPNTDWVSFQVVIEIISGCSSNNSNFRYTYADTTTGQTSSSFVKNYIDAYDSIPNAPTDFRNFITGLTHSGVLNHYAGYVSSGNPFPATSQSQLSIKGLIYNLTSKRGLAIEFGPDQDSLKKFDEQILYLNAALEGLQNNPTTRERDTITVILRDGSQAPYNIIQQSNIYLDSAISGSKKYGMAYIPLSYLEKGKPYYIVVKHRNSISSWSNLISTISDTLSYDFTMGISQTFGNNSVFVNDVASFYTGDVNQSGLVDINDVLLIYNDANIFKTGNYLTNDLNWDGIVDVTDVLLVYNNSSNFISEKKPSGALSLITGFKNYNYEEKTETIVSPDVYLIGKDNIETK